MSEATPKDDVTKAWETFDYWRRGSVERRKAVEKAREALKEEERELNSVECKANNAWTELQKLLGREPKPSYSVKL